MAVISHYFVATYELALTSADLLEQPDYALIACIEEFLSSPSGINGKSFLKILCNVPRSISSMIWYRHHLLVFRNNARQVDMASFAD